MIFPKIPPILPKKLPQKGSFRQKGMTFGSYGTSLLPRQLNFSKNREVWRKWAIWLVVEFTEQGANLVIFSNSNQGKIFPARVVIYHEGHNLGNRILLFTLILSESHA